MRTLLPLMRQQLADAIRGDRGWFTGLWTGLVAIAILTIPKMAFIDAIGIPTPFLLYFGAILIATYRGGVVAGVVTTATSAVVTWVLFLETDATGFLRHDLPALLVFAFEGVCISLVMGGFVVQRRRAEQAAQKAKSSQAQRDLVLSGLEEGIALQDPQGRMVYANQLAAEYSGCTSPEELLALSPQQVLNRLSLFDLDGQRLPLEQLPGRRLLNGERSPEIVVRFLKPGETEDRWGLLRANALRDEKGNVEFVVNLFRDITDTHRRDAELKVAREWFQIALQSIGDAVIATDAEGRVNLLNPVAEQLTGWTMEKAFGLPLEDVFKIIREDTRESVESPVRQVLRSGAVVGLANHTLLIRSDGSEIAIDDSAAPIRGSGDSLAGVILVFRDVSAKRTQEGRATFLARATEELNSSLDYRTALSTVARLAVPGVADWCAVDILQEGELTRLDVAHVDPQKIECVRELERRYPSDPQATSGVYQVLRTGKPEWIETIPQELLEASAQDEEHKRRILDLGLESYIAVPLTRAGKPFGVITLAMAESKRHYKDEDFRLAISLADRASLAIENARLFSDAEAARCEAEAANRTKDEFLAMLGHELRNPLAPIRSALEFMGKHPSKSHEREVLVIRRQVDHLVRLVDDLLDVARITNGRLELNRTIISVPDVVARAREMVWPAFVEPDHHVHIEVEPGLQLNGDFVRLAQVIANLLTNSVKYTPKEGSIWVKATGDEDRISISIRDDGMGIGSETLRLVFDLFVQEPQAIDRSQGGLGLGLAIVRGIVSAHGGSVKARSEGLGQGAEFIVDLPVGDLSIEAPLKSETSSPPTISRRILIVDDNEDACELLGMLLSADGHEVFTTNSATKALAVAAEQGPEIALLDIGLPEMSGYQLGEELRKLPGLEDIRLIAITGYGQLQDRKRSQAARFQAHLVKPVDLNLLNKALQVTAAAVARDEASDGDH